MRKKISYFQLIFNWYLWTARWYLTKVVLINLNQVFEIKVIIYMPMMSTLPIWATLSRVVPTALIQHPMGVRCIKEHFVYPYEYFYHESFLSHHSTVINYNRIYIWNHPSKMFPEFIITRTDMILCPSWKEWLLSELCWLISLSVAMKFFQRLATSSSVRK